MALNFQVDEATAAQRRFPIYLVDAADGITAETGEAAGQPQISKNGAAFGNTSATLVAIGNGSYYVELTAGELDTLGMVTIRFKSAATAEFSLTGQVVAYDPYAAYALASIATEARLSELDAATGGKMANQVDIIEVDTTSLNDTKIPDTLSLVNINAEVDTALVDARLDELISATAGAVAPVIGSLLDLIMNADGGQTFAQATDSLEAAANTVIALNDLAQSDILNDATPFPGASITEARLSELDAATGGKMANQVDVIEVDTTSLNDTKIPDTLSLVNINAEVDTALVDARLDELISATAGGVDAVIGSLLDLIMNTGVGQTFAQGTDSLEAAADTVLALNDLAQSDILSDATPFPGASVTEVRLAELAAANLPTDIDNIQTDTGEIGVAGAGLTAVSRAVNPQVNTALSDITFEMYDSTTHNPSTGLTVSGERSLNGGAYAAVTGSITEISDGTYQLDASQADMNGALIAFRFFEATADDTFVHVKTAA